MGKEEDEMVLPKGKTCADCASFFRCKALFGANELWVACDFYPSRFVIAITTNTAFASTNKAFREACERANIPPTKRQASKWRRKAGLAFKSGNSQL